MFRFFLLFILLSLLSSCGDEENASTPTTNSFPLKLTFSGFGSHGFFDPSLTLEPTTNRLWMSYSSVEESALWPTQNRESVTTRLAYSTDAGLTWTDSGAVVNNFTDVTLAAAAPNNAGTWHHEVSKLIYDPGASSSERWKLFWHHYLLVDGDRKFEHGWISYKAASTPENLASAGEIKLFTGAGYSATNNIAGNATTQSPLGGAPVAIQGLDTDLNTCVAFTEPGAYASSSALYISLLCPTAGNDNQIVVLKCTSPCDASNVGNWNYLGTALNNTAASNLGLSKFSGTEIIQFGEKLYLMVSPVSNSPVLNAYNGCLIFQFADIETASLVGGSTPTMIRSISGAANSFNGACGYHENSSAGGFLYSEAIIGSSIEFQIFLSGQTL